MQDTELVVTATLCLASGIFTFQRKIHIPPLRERLFWCVARTQFVLILTLFEGGLLCVGN
jgi:hypothetical protein